MPSVPSRAVDAVFDATEVIAGFPLVAIKRALVCVGLLDDRDDVATVTDSLGCGRSQAERVLAALEKRGFVTRTKTKNQWEPTQLAHQLVLNWRPPRRITPVIYREDEDDAPTNEVFDSVPCSILRPVEEDDVLEEADLEVGVFVDIETDRVVQIDVSQPDDYETRDGGGLIDKRCSSPSTRPSASDCDRTRRSGDGSSRGGEAGQAGARACRPEPRRGLVGECAGRSATDERSAAAAHGE